MGILTGFLDLLFPEKCVFCRKALKKGEVSMCAACVNGLPFTPEGGRQEGRSFDVCVSPLYNEGTVNEAVMRFKFRDATNYAGLFGKLIAECIRDNLKGQYDLISWVPLSAAQLKKRGYDQAMLLAMAAALELDDVAVETLEKHVDVPAQSGIDSRDHRQANIAGTFRAVDPELIADKRILLIDDIVSTGSTLNECAATLLGAGATKVVCATLVRAIED